MCENRSAFSLLLKDETTLYANRLILSCELLINTNDSYAKPLKHQSYKVDALQIKNIIRYWQMI